jgi:hypothetical protein
LPQTGDRLFVEWQLLRWRQSTHFFLGLGFTENTVELPSGEFVSHLSRLRYEPVAGREMLLVLNHGSGIENDNSLFSTNREIVLKVSHTFCY